MVYQTVVEGQKQYRQLGSQYLGDESSLKVQVWPDTDIDSLIKYLREIGGVNRQYIVDRFHQELNAKT